METSGAHSGDVTSLLAPTDLVNDPGLRVRPPTERVPRTLQHTQAGDVFAELVRWHDGDEHRWRRARVERFIASLDPTRLEHRAFTLGLRAPDPARAAFDVPLAVLATALGVAPGDCERAVELARAAARGMGPGATGDPAEAIGAVPDLLGMLPDDGDLDAANRVGLLLQTCDAVAALVTAARCRAGRGATESSAAALVAAALAEEPPVRSARRFRPDGEPVAVDLAGHPFGAGPHRCPGEAVAVALAVGTVDGLRHRPTQPASAAAIARMASRG